MASRFSMRGLPVACLCLGLCLGAGPALTVAQQAPPPDQQQDEAPPPYPPQDQAPAQNPQQDQGPAQYPQQDQGAPQYPTQDQGAPQYPQQDQGAPPQGGAPQGGTQFAPQGPEQSPDGVARISFVQGDVKMMSNGRTDFQQAVANMPLVANSSLQTGENGEAEVEFADGSVARITPNSSLALGQIGQDSVEMQQNSGLVYYELNFGEGHPPFRVDLPNAEVVPAANTIFRIDLDNTPEAAVMTGSVELSGGGFADVAVGAGQTFVLQPSNSGPYTIAQDITPDSWDQWNDDRDQAISQEAAQQTSARDQVGDSGDENWNDLDAYGNWYSLPNTGNVWVPGGVSAGWDPFGYGYWGNYPGFGYTYISGYPWGWLPYHCGLWNYYAFGWGWSPGGCGRGWFPVVGIHGYRGYVRPGRPALTAGVRAGALVAVDRGPQARGPWGAGHPLPYIDHDAALNVGGHALTPLGRASFHAQTGARGTSPGVRAALRSPGSTSPGSTSPGSTNPGSTNPGEFDRSFDRPGAADQYRAPSEARPNSRSTYTPRSTPTPHYSAPPSYHYSAPARSGGGRGR